MKHIIEATKQAILERKQRVHYAIQEKKHLEQRILQDVETIDELETELKGLEFPTTDGQSKQVCQKDEAFVKN